MPEPTPGEMSFEVLAKAVDDAAAKVATLDEAPRRAAGELRAAIEAAHRAALVTIVTRLRADDAGRALLYELVDDPLIRMVFSLHAIIRTGAPPGVSAGVGAAGEHAGHQDSGGGCGCGHQGGASPQAGPALIPVSALRRGSGGALAGGTA